jgi:hypothetical protein
MYTQYWCRRVCIGCHLDRSTKKKKATKKKTNVSDGKTKMDQMLKRKELPYVRRLWPMYRVRVVRCVVGNVDGNKKMMKMQRRNKKKDWRAKVILVA